jgi:hypothetical protein
LDGERPIADVPQQAGQVGVDELPAHAALKSKEEPLAPILVVHLHDPAVLATWAPR